MKHTRLTLIALLLQLNAAHAVRPKPEVSTQRDEEAELLDMLSEETEVATRSKQNADFVPGVVSVLQGDDLAALGKRTVLDALALVPGIEANRDSDGNATLRVRGFDFFFNSGNVKVLVDSIDMAAEVSGSNSAVLLMPISQVERIEVIRGPGSNLYGDFAFTGLVNIVTLKNQRRVSGASGNGGAREAVVSYSHEGEPWHLGFNFSDFLAEDFQSVDQLPPDEHRRFGNVNVGFLGFTLQGSWFDRDSARLGPNGNRARRYEQLSHFSLQQHWEFGAECSLRLSAARQDADSQIAASNYKGYEWRYTLDGQWRQGAQLWLFEVSRLNQTIERGFFPPAPPQPGQRPNPVVDLRNVSRTLNSIMLQDQFDLSSKLTATVGVRFDALADVDHRLTPRGALVWRANDHHTFKAQYAQGFRTPTAIELYSSGRLNERIDFESIRTSELSYIYHYSLGKLRVTAFDAKVPNAIFRRPAGGPPGHENRDGPKSTGVELEWTHDWNDQLSIAASYAYADTEDPRSVPRNPQSSTGAAPRTPPNFGAARGLLNLSALWRPNATWDFGAHLLHVGQRETPPDRVDGFDQLDLAITHHFNPSLDLRVSVRNAGKAHVSYLANVPQGRTQIADYAERIGLFEVLWNW